MRKVLVTAATFQPLDIEEIKLRPEVRGFTTDDDDPMLLRFMTSAIEAYQDYTGHVLCLSTWDLYLDEFEDETELPSPLSSISSVNYCDSNAAWQVLATTYYTYDTRDAIKARLTLKYGQSWPSTYDEINSVRIRFVAGYADAESIPYRVIDGIVLYVQQLYDGIDRRAWYESCWAADARLAV